MTGVGQCLTGIFIRALEFSELLTRAGKSNVANAEHHYAWQPINATLLSSDD